MTANLVPISHQPGFFVALSEKTRWEGEHREPRSSGSNREQPEGLLDSAGARLY
jgi:hypothetical protein